MENMYSRFSKSQMMAVKPNQQTSRLNIRWNIIKKGPKLYTMELAIHKNWNMYPVPNSNVCTIGLVGDVNILATKFRLL